MSNEARHSNSRLMQACYTAFLPHRQVPAQFVHSVAIIIIVIVKIISWVIAPVFKKAELP